MYPSDLNNIIHRCQHSKAYNNITCTHVSIICQYYAQLSAFESLQQYYTYTCIHHISTMQCIVANIHNPTTITSHACISLTDIKMLYTVANIQNIYNNNITIMHVFLRNPHLYTVANFQKPYKNNITIIHIFHRNPHYTLLLPFKTLR